LSILLPLSFSAIHPELWPSTIVRDRHDHQQVTGAPEDDAEWIPPHGAVTMAIVALWKSVRIPRDGVEYTLELSLESFGGANASLDVPSDRLSVVALCG
jgi:hypothetical protein